MEEKENLQTEETNEYDEIWENKDVTFDDLLNAGNEEKTEEPVVGENNIEQQEDNLTNPEPQQQTGSNYITLTRPLKYRGKEFYPQTEEELIELAQKGLDYSFKMNKIKPYRQLIELLESNGISAEDAINKLNSTVGSNRTTEENAFANSESTHQQNTNVNEGHILYPYVQELGRIDGSLPSKVINTFDNIDPSFKVEITSNNLIKPFITSVVNGEFSRVYPVATNVKNANPYMSWGEAYSIASKQIANNATRDVSKETSEELRTNKVKKEKPRPKTIEEQYNEIWDNGKINTVEELERTLIEGV